MLSTLNKDLFFEYLKSHTNNNIIKKDDLIDFAINDTVLKTWKVAEILYLVKILGFKVIK